MTIEEMNKEELEKTLKQAFDLVARRAIHIFAMERKIKELGGDPFFYLTGEERVQREKSEEWIKNLDIFKGTKNDA